MQALKRRMYAMRNGIVADSLRKAGCPFKVIFGVNLPQLAEIAADMPRTREFACQVWDNNTARESQLIAPMLMPVESFSVGDARKWISEACTDEVIDVLCLKLIRKCSFAADLASELINEDDSRSRYAGLRIFCNLAPSMPAQAAKIGAEEAAKNDPRTKRLAEILLSYGEM